MVPVPPCACSLLAEVCRPPPVDDLLRRDVLLFFKGVELALVIDVSVYHCFSGCFLWLCIAVDIHRCFCVSPSRRRPDARASHRNFAAAPAGGGDYHPGFTQHGSGGFYHGAFSLSIVQRAYAFVWFAFIFGTCVHVLCGQEYFGYLARTKYGLVPQGEGLHSYRLLEVIAAGAVPVVVAAQDNTVLPFQALIAWDDLAITVRHADLSGLAVRLRAIPDVEWRARQARLAGAYVRYFCTTAHWMAVLFQELRRRIIELPGPVG